MLCIIIQSLTEHKVCKTIMTPSQTYQNRLDLHLLTLISEGIIKEYMPTKFEACGLKRSDLSNLLHKVRGTDMTYQPTHMWKAICPSFFKGEGGGGTDMTYQSTHMCKAICPSFFKGGGGS